MDLRRPSVLLLLCAFHLHLASVLNKHVDHRNLFAQRACCKRQSHFVYIGQDISGRPLSVDVGMCRSHCVGTPSTNEAGQQEYSKHSSMLEFLRSKLRMRGSASESAETLSHLPSCRATQICEPTGLRVDRLLLFEGPREVEVIEECHCETKLTQCVRVPALRTYFFETPYETVIDVGVCSQAKGSPEGFSCVPTRFDSALVETPNKVDLIQTVEACELKESCYRVPYVEYYYEIIDHDNGLKEERLKLLNDGRTISTEEVTNASDTVIEYLYSFRHLQEIDVGRCLGGCTTGNRCLLRSPSDSASCHLWAERSSNSCVPQSNESHTFLNQHGQIRSVLSIKSCLCQD